MSDNSLFYNQKRGRRFPVPLYAFEVYALESSESSSDEQLQALLIYVLHDVCGVASPVPEDVEYFIERLNDLSKPPKESESPPPKNKSFGTSYMDYLIGLPIDSVLLKMVQYDVKKAEHLYCVIDRSDVVALVDSYLLGKMEENSVAMEAAMYGFGGRYEEDKPEKTRKEKGVDISSKEGEAALRSLGF